MQWEALLKQIAPQVLATLVRRYRDFPAAEDAVQEALRCDRINGRDIRAAYVRAVLEGK